MKKYILLILILLPAYFSNLSAQTCKVKVSGTVLDAETKEPMPGVTVVIKNTHEATFTQVDGSYSINASDEDILVFSFVGYETQTIPVDGRDRIDLEMHVFVNNIHEWLICSKTFLEPGITSCSYFPYGINFDMVNNKLLYCCEIGHRLILETFYGTNFNSNEILHARFGLDYFKIRKARLGIVIDYDRIDYSQNNENFLISEYKFNLVINSLFKYLKGEIGAGNQTFNGTNNAGIGGKIYLTNNFGYVSQKLTAELFSGYWNWKTEYEYNIGFNLFLYINHRNANPKFIRWIKLGSSLNKFNNLRFVSFNISAQFVTKRQAIGCH